MKLLFPLLGGASAMFLAMGVARFSFTPLLPLMQADYTFSDTISGALASSNYLGYLLGALYARFVKKESARLLYNLYIIASLVFVGLMFVNSQPLWYLLRFLSGFSSALIFILGSEFVMDYLVKKEKTEYLGIIYSGIGGGMVLSGLTIPFLSGFFNSAQIWLWLAVLSIIPALFSLYGTPGPTPAVKPPENEKNISKTIYLLSVSYFLEGLGYIITGTFLSVIILRSTDSVMFSGYAWVITGLGAVAITPLWTAYAKRKGLLNAIMAAFAVQTVSIAAPAFTTNTLINFAGAFGYGGTFLGVVSLTLAYGRQISPGGSTTALLTIMFSIGQMLGPFIAGYAADITGGFRIPVLGAATCTALGGIIILIIKKGEKNADT